MFTNSRAGINLVYEQSMKTKSDIVVITYQLMQVIAWGHDPIVRRGGYPCLDWSETDH